MYSSFICKGEDINSTRLSLKLPSSRKIERYFLKSDKVSVLFALASKEYEIADKAFTIKTAMPIVDLAEKIDMTLEEAGILNSQVILRLI